MKKLCSLVLGICLLALCLCLLPQDANAATSEYYVYIVTNGKATITDCSTSISGAITIPNTLDGYPVTAIGSSAFRDCTGLTSVTIGSSVTSINNYAFIGCTGLTAVNIGSNVASIGHMAFYGCTGLSSIIIPDSVTNLDNYAFSGCKGLISVTIGNSVANLGRSVFYGCTGLTSVTIGSSVTSIGDSAFSNCTGLTSITIPDGVSSIGYQTFSGCTGLTSVTIGSSVTSIGSSVFDNCTGLTDLYITDPNSWCKISFGDSSTPMHYEAQLHILNEQGEEITELVLDDSVTTIPNYAFSGCTGLTSITVPDSVTSIGNGAFYGCSNLESITLPFIGRDRETESYIYPFGYIFGVYEYPGSDATKQCYYLYSSSSTNTITYYIPESLKTVTITDDTDIQQYAFIDCTRLTRVTIPDKVTSIGRSAFQNCTSLTAITIPDSVIDIGNYAFQNCPRLTAITIPDSVTDIGSSAFSDCIRLTSVTIGSGIAHVGEYAFLRCSALTDVYISDPISWCKISYDNNMGNPMYYKVRLHILNEQGEEVTELVLDDSVTKIPNYAFKDCTGLTSVTIGKRVTSVGFAAFNGCTGLQTVFYRGTEEQKRSISIDVYNTSLTNATWHYEVTDVQSGEERVYQCGKCNFRYCMDGTKVPLTQISVLKAPDDVRYCTGGVVFLDGISLQGTYADGSTVTLGATAIETVVADLSSPGRKTAAVTVMDCSAEFEIIVHDGDLVTVDSSLYPESDHNYGNYLSQTKTFTYPGAISLIITFSSQTSMESNYDYIYVYDGSGKQIAKYTDTAAAGVTLAIPGDTFQIKLTSNSSGTRYGYAFTSIVADMGVEIHIPLEGYGTLTPPTCSEQGYTQFTCSICGDLYNDDYTDYLPHTYSPWVLSKVATCTTDGAISRSCSVCSYIESVAVAATGHSFETVTTPPTCSEAGIETRTCTTCQAVETATIAATGHSYEIVTTPPTCTEEGVEYRTCAVCGAAESVAIPAAGHSYDSSVTPPTCTTDGYTTHTCSTCGNSYTDSKTAATGHSFGNWVIGKLPTCDTDGSMVRTCTVCSEQESLPVTASGHSYEHGVCSSCGKADPESPTPVVMPVITPKYPSLSFEDEVYISVYFTVSDMTDVVELGLVVSSDETVDEHDTLITKYDYKYNSGLYGVRTHGIPAKSLGETIYFKVYAKLADGSYAYSGVYNYSALAYAKDRLANSSNENLKKLCVAMLNYGAAAQTYMGYNVDSLANATLTADQLTMVEGYNSSMIASVTAVDSDKMGNFTFSGFSKRYPSVSFEGAFGISYYFTPSFTPDNGMKLYYWDKEAFDGVDVLTVDNATGVLDMTVSGTAYKGAVEGIAAKEVDETIFVAGVYEYNGVTYTTGILPYSLGAYCVDRAANGSAAMKPLAEATAVYGYYAKQYFAA